MSIKIPIKDAIAAACVVYEKQGYVKKNQTGPDGEKPNVVQVQKFFTDPDYYDSIDITDAAREEAEEVIFSLQGLAIKAIDRGLSKFENTTLKLIDAGEVEVQDLGLISSLPKIYKSKEEQDEWIDRERELARTSEFVGDLNRRQNFTNLTVENVLVRDSSDWGKVILVCCSDANGSIIKFFQNSETCQKGDKINIVAYVKAHKVSDYHHGKETMVNRVHVDVLK